MVLTPRVLCKILGWGQLCFPVSGKMASGIYLLSSRLRPAMCCSKDLTPKPLPFLLLRAPSSLSAAEASCFSFHSCGEPKLLLSDLYYNHRKNREKLRGGACLHPYDAEIGPRDPERSQKDSFTIWKTERSMFSLQT